MRQRRPRPTGLPSVAFGGLAGGVLLLSALLPTGCASWSYQQVRIGQQLRQSERVFPEGRSRRTAATLAYLEHDPFGGSDAVVLLLGQDRVVCGRLRASHYRRNYGFKVDLGYTLQGELDPKLCNLRDAGPIDALRAVADELTGSTTDSFVREAHGWVAAGLVRLIQSWPHPG